MNMYKLGSPDWEEGWAVDNYFIPGTEETTETGNLIRYHKYGGIKATSQLSASMKNLIISAWSKEPPFDVVVPVPGSLPEDMARNLGYTTYHVEKLKDIKAKTMGFEERKMFLYNFKSHYLRASKGILVIDDVFDTGNSLMGVCKALQKYSLPIYVAVLAINNHPKRNSGH